MADRTRECTPNASARCFFFDLSIRIERRKRQERTFWKAKQFPCCIAARCTVFCPAPPRGCEMPSPQSSCDAFTHSDALKQHTNTSIKCTVFPQCVLARVMDAEKQRNDAGRRGTMQIARHRTNPIIPWEPGCFSPPSRIHLHASTL